MRSSCLALAVAVALIYSQSSIKMSQTNQSVFRSHAPKRSLPTAAKRPMEKGPAYFVDPVKGHDGQDGSEAKPWKTVTRGAKFLKPGDTLYLRGGVYYEAVIIAAKGT